MAFQAMMGGAECSTSNNPLSSLLKQQQTDHSLHHQSQLHPNHGAAHAATMRTMSASPSHAAQEEAERFLQHQQLAGPGSGDGLTMEAMRRELESLNHQGGGLRGDRAQTEWSSQYHPAGAALSPHELARMEQQFRAQQQSLHSTSFAAEFSQQRQHYSPHALAGTSVGGSTSSDRSSMGTSMFSRPGFAPSYGSYPSLHRPSSMPMPVYSPQQVSVDTKQNEGKGKNRFVELDDRDWEEQFAKAASAPQDPQTESLTAELEERQDAKANLLDEGEINLDATESDAQLMKDLEATWSQLKGQLNASNEADRELAQWEAQYGSQFNDIHGSPSLFDDEQEDLFGLPDMRRGKEWTRDNVDSFLADESPFPYSEENQYLNAPDPYQEGMRLLAEGAPLSEAALAFEAACRKDETRAEAWKAAGETWAADEREAKGIRALEKAVACGGTAGVAAWMSLAVAYVNEGQELRALATLEKWLSLSYPTISLSPPPQADTARSPWDASNRIIDLFLAAAQSGPQSRSSGSSGDINAIVDPDVQVGLGVLFYSNSDYERAKDCFEAALSVRPDDFLLWNRLGATLANGGLPEEAISAYRKALELRPTFTRATYNLGVSCLNIGCYHEAAEHLLAAIQGQNTRAAAQAGKGKSAASDEDIGRAGPNGEADDGSANLWHTLRRAFLCMERHDLANKAFPGAGVESFRREGFEF
ncbi:tetratricopeptide repeat protein [Sporobolomyces koalae]|uniref:tetratricopeptide repeat protein n=1 Tax=Sporobolomyces koalae TaxID=500713 RepID=UPI0031758E99